MSNQSLSEICWLNIKEKIIKLLGKKESCRILEDELRSHWIKVYENYRNNGLSHYASIVNTNKLFGYMEE